MLNVGKVSPVGDSQSVFRCCSLHTQLLVRCAAVCAGPMSSTRSHHRCSQSVIQFPGCDVTSEREDKAVLRQPWERQKGSSDWGKVAGNKVQTT